ncbi:phage virion morphogenesis protein [Pseudomonas fluorescens]|uniref:phage virion morphogenesis protein n=1 Tax=Pseudomonas fluorescens TaxID=294 RepID=UPI00068DB06A|nr:phage virion morphogenesis protein [Pseudomonas fluorescens]
MSGIEALNTHLDGLLAQLEPGARRALAKAIAKEIQPRQRKRIADQLNPDGSPFAKRKPQLRQKAGRVRRTMFSKLRTARYLKTSATSNSAVIGFVGEVERIARVHQFGLRDRVQKGGKEAQYAPRELLGFTDDDVSAIHDLVISHLAR